jgi:hypothetical protein
MNKEHTVAAEKLNRAKYLAFRRGRKAAREEQRSTDLSAIRGNFVYACGLLQEIRDQLTKISNSVLLKRREK